jgi:hypothetical protein
MPDAKDSIDAFWQPQLLHRAEEFKLLNTISLVAKAHFIRVAQPIENLQISFSFLLPVGFLSMVEVLAQTFDTRALPVELLPEGDTLLLPRIIKVNLFVAFGA